MQIVVVSNLFPGLAGQFDAMVEDALDIGVLTCIEAADPQTRRDTGALVANKTIGRGQGWRDVTWNQDYAAYQNDGTRFMEGTQFANRGADAALPVIQDRLGRFGS